MYILSLFLMSTTGMIQLCLSDSSSGITLEPLVTYEIDADKFDLVVPRFMDFDHEDNLYILDTSIKKVHVWDDKGVYQTSFGGEGEGPGELMLSTPVGDLAVFKDEIIIVDESTAKIHFFDLKTHQFERTMTRPSDLNRIFLYRTKNNLFVLDVSASKKRQRILKINSQFQIEKVMIERPLNTWEYKENNSYIFRPLANRLLVQSNQDHLFIFESRHNKVYVFDASGEQVRVLTVPVILHDLDQDAFTENSLDARSFPGASVELPDKDNAIDSIFLLNDVLLVAHVDKANHNIDGKAYDYQFNDVGDFKAGFGELFHYEGFHGRLVLIGLDESGAYRINTYKAARSL